MLLGGYVAQKENGSLLFSCFQSNPLLLICDDMEFVVKATKNSPLAAPAGGLAGPGPSTAHAAFKERENRSAAPLVIPLVKKEDEEAALAVIADASSKGESSSHLVIGTPGDEERRAAKALVGEVPLLMAGRLPGLEDAVDESDKFRKDLSMRAEDVAASSDSYERVPIEEFGAAVLRGMGWTGPTKEDDERFASNGPVRREARLGLGAVKKPAEVFDKRGKLIDGKKRKWLGATRDEAERLKAMRRRRFALGEVVRLHKAETRARIIEIRDDDQTALVEIEKTGQRKVEPLNYLDRVSTQSLLSERFVQYKKSGNGGDAKSTSKKSHPSSSGHHDREKKRADWLCAGIRVRVVRDGDPLYRQKGRVIDVIRKDADGPLRAILLLDSSGDVVHDPGIREKHLETALPKDGGRIKAVFGKHKGRTGRLVRRQKQRQTVLLSFDDDEADILEVAMDDVAELCDDDDDVYS